MKSKKKLSAANLENYKAANQNLGLPEETQTHAPVKHLKSKTVVYSSDPLESDVPPKVLMVSSIEELKKIMGNPVQQDKHIEYPPALSRKLSLRMVNAKNLDDLKKVLTPKEHDNIKKAMHAYLVGNPKKVKKYVPLINAMRFPTKVAYFASPEDKVISGNVVVKGEVPVIWNYNTIKMKGNASLHVQAPMFITANNLVSANDKGDKVINCSAPNYSTPATSGITGGQGPNGPSGVPGTCRPDPSIEGTPMVCVKEPTDGAPGGSGGSGTSGASGMKGYPQLPFYFTIREAITGNLTIIAGGGDGQIGGKGGSGGSGGNGGAPGAVCGPCRPANAGQQGNGGKGGNGGAGGNGGDGGVVTIFYKSISGKIIIQRDQAQGGAGGDAGSGGPGSPQGANGNAGATGALGTKSVINVGPIS